MLVALAPSLDIEKSQDSKKGSPISTMFYIGRLVFRLRHTRTPFFKDARHTRTPEL